MENKNKESWIELRKTVFPSKEKVFSKKTTGLIMNSLEAMLHFMARYKFVVKMLANREHLRVVDLGCCDGIGDLMIRQSCSCDYILGVDFDDEFISWAQDNISDSVLHFLNADFLSMNNEGGYIPDGNADCVLAIDVIEHIASELEDTFMKVICESINNNGFAIIGTPNITMFPYASPWNKKGHINNYDQKRLYELLNNYFNNVFIFGMNDEVLHTGFYPFSCYIMALACGKR